MPWTPYSQASYQYHSTKYRERNCYSKYSLSRITIYSRTPAQCFTKQCNKWSLCNLHLQYKQGHRLADSGTVCIQFCSPSFLESFLKIHFFKPFPSSPQPRTSPAPIPPLRPFPLDLNRSGVHWWVHQWTRAATVQVLASWQRFPWTGWLPVQWRGNHPQTGVSTGVG